MRLCKLVEGVRRSGQLALVVAMAACGNGTQSAATPPPSVAAPANGNHGSSDSGPTPGSSSSGGQPSSASGSEAESGAEPDAESEGDALQSASDGDDGASEVDAAPSCVKGQVTADEVVMLGDSYLDAPWGDVGPTLMMEANATYRHYYIGGAAMAWGNPDTQFYIPYQYDPMAKTDTAVMNPTDIKVIIMDGGGNDVLIGNTSCEQTAPPGNTSCVTTIQSAIGEAQTLMHQMAADGVKSIVFFFYPHLDPAGGGILLTPAPAINDTLDYAYPLAEQICCGSTFTSTLSSPTCSGQPVPGTTCVFVDTRPSFEGHLADYIKSDHVHPTPAGAQVISDLLWKAMQDHCIAQ
ncbi:MAG TPA: SGNH/GDSL hydrolase family protein [Polyangiaceae bacterium]|nr:SGNH/GDSL hydrolase family protein [Polyangiaceae bacterium]